MYVDKKENMLESSKGSHLSFLNGTGNYYKSNFCDSLDDDDDSACAFCPKLFNYKEAFIMLNDALY